VGILLAVVLVLGACGSSSKKSSNSTTTSAASSTSSSTPAGKPLASDVGITDSTIRVAVIADVQTAVNPGLFQKSINAVKAWAAIVNENGGLAGRQIAVDAIDSMHDPNTSRNAVIQACSQDFAMVGTEMITLTNTSDLDTCKNSQGQAVGIPNLAGIVFGALQQCDPVTFAVLGNNPTYCQTYKDNPQTYTEQVGDAKWFLSQNPGLHGLWLYNSDVPAARATQVPTYTAQSQQGIKLDGQGFYGSSGTDPQSALIPVVQVIKQHGSTFAGDGVTPPNLVLLRREAQLQSVSSVKVWECLAGCYVPYFIQQGSSAVNGTYQLLNTIAFYSEYQSNPSLSGLVQQLGGINNLDSNALSSYIEALLFQDAINKAVANGGTLSRQTLFNVLHNQETSFNASGITGTTDVSTHSLSPCFSMAQVVNGQWQRVYPSQAGSFDCNSGNLVQVKLNMNG
jgi:hypothetical protein